MATGSASPPSIVWFKRDLRLADNPALAKAVQSGAPLCLVYIHSNDPEDRLTPGGASEWWLHQSLKALDQSVRELGGQLHLRAGDAAKILPELCEQLGAKSVYWNQSSLPWVDKRDQTLGRDLIDRGIEPRVFRSTVMLDHASIRNKTGGPFKVFSAFWRTASALCSMLRAHAAPTQLNCVSPTASDRLEAWKLEPTHPNWAARFPEFWTPGERGARQRLEQFIDSILEGYKANRDRPDMDGTSRLSPHLAFGEISPRQIWLALDSAAEVGGPIGDIEKFRAEIGWREFAYYLFEHFGDLRERSFNPVFNAFPWRQDADHFDRWKRGMTGIPMVDAGMRQLWTSGWIHNRVRMNTASYLVKHLGLHWQEGMRWFEDTLVDADPVVNAASWQWVAGSGADAAPYFRIFNPVTQGQKFDPDGHYVREWVPEAAHRSNRTLHDPISLPGYPAPPVDLKKGREAALAAYANMKDAAD